MSLKTSIKARNLAMLLGTGGNRVFSGPLSTSSTTAALVVGTLYASPMFIPYRSLLKRIGIRVTTAAAGGHVRLGIYANSSGVPGALILDAGVVTTDTTGAKTIVINTIYAPGWYWVGAISDATPTLTVSTTPLTWLGEPTGTDTTVYDGYSKAAQGYDVLPDPFPAGTLVVSVPRTVVELLDIEILQGQTDPNQHARMADIGHAAGRYYPGPLGTGLTTLHVTAAQLYAVPWYAPGGITYEEIGVQVTTGSAAAKYMRFGIYNDDPTTGLPTTLYHDCGADAVASSTTGWHHVDTSHALPTGWYWLAVICEEHPYLEASRYPLPWLGFGTATGTASEANSAGISVASTYGALPDPFPGSPTYEAIVPRMMLKVPA